jgi:NitT/TauT family transport system permease protein
MRRFAWQSLLALLLSLAGAVMLPLANAVSALPFTIGQSAAIVLLLLASVAVSMSGINRQGGAIFLLFAVHLAAFMLVGGIAGNEGAARPSFYCLLAAAWLLAWRLVVLLCGLKPASRVWTGVLRFLVPLLFGLWILILWEGITRGAGVPFVLLPPPTAIAARLVTSLPVIGADVRQTIFKAVLAGYLIGCGSGFLTAILADRVAFLRKGLLPIGNLVSALPIVGIAPIMVMWFGFDWPSKAAVVVVMTFFPMLVNTVAGLAASGHMERDLMRTYASNYWQTLFKLRLPAAAPFIFNALKINSTLALIGAIVAEFFGTPIVGMGFRISTEVGRMNVDMVWAEIAVAALAGSIFYGVVAFIERIVTFWHPSIRGG